MSSSPILSLVITTYNSSGVIKNCLDKINFDKYLVYVVDNNSSDDTVKIIENEYLAKYPKSLVIFKNNKNLGYGRGNNTALRAIKTDYALILNPDAFIFENDIEKIIKKLDSHPEIAIGAPVLLNKFPFDEKNYQQQIDVINDNLIANFGDFKSVKYVIGACLVLRMSFFAQHGFYDEKIFLYYEDDEISYRVTKNNKICAIIEEAYAYHIGHGSCGNNSHDIYRRFWHRALSKFYWKEKQKGFANAYFSASKLAISFLIQAIFYSLTLNRKKIFKNLGALNGTLAYLLRLSAFDKHDNPRGNLKLF